MGILACTQVNDFSHTRIPSRRPQQPDFYTLILCFFFLCFSKTSFFGALGQRTELIVAQKCSKIYDLANGKHFVRTLHNIFVGGGGGIYVGFVHAPQALIVITYVAGVQTIA